MAWLVREAEVLASLEIADGRRSRRRGLLRRDGFEGALLLRPARGVHTFGMRFDIDVAYLDADLCVLECVSMARNRLGRPRLRARAVVEAERGAFARWALAPGQQLEIKC